MERTQPRRQVRRMSYPPRGKAVRRVWLCRAMGLGRRRSWEWLNALEPIPEPFPEHRVLHLVSPFVRRVDIAPPPAATERSGSAPDGTCFEPRSRPPCAGRAHEPTYLRAIPYLRILRCRFVRPIPSPAAAWCT